MDPSVVSDMIAKLESKFCKLMLTHGTKHGFLGMYITFNKNVTITIRMISYIQQALEAFKDLITNNAATPATRHLFKL